MNHETATDQKATTSAPRAPGSGCCGGNVTAEPQENAATHVDHDKHSTFKAAESSCCCGTKDTRQSDPKSSGAVQK